MPQWYLRHSNEMSFSDVRSWLQSHDFTLHVVYQWLKGKEKIGISARLFNHHSFFSFLTHSGAT